MDDDKTNPFLEALLTEVASLSSEYSVNLSDVEFQKTDLGGKMLGMGITNVMGKYPTADEQKQVLNSGLDWMGKKHGVQSRYLVGDSIVKGLVRSGLIPKDDAPTNWLGITKKPVETLFNFFQANPDIGINSGLHALDEDKFGPQ